MNLNRAAYDSVNLYFQDESRFGLMTHLGSCITARGVKPIVKYKQGFKSTYLFGSFSPINGASFVWEVDGVSSALFAAYLEEFSRQSPREYKILLLDNAGFHSTKNIKVPQNIKLLNIPAYSPELNPAERIWQYLKSIFKNRVFATVEEIKEWLYQTVKEQLSCQRVKSIVMDSLYYNHFMAHFN